MLKKDGDVKWTNPSEEHLKAFRYLNKSLESPPVLGLPKIDGRYMVDKDTRKYALGAVLLQEQEKSTEKRQRTGRKEIIAASPRWNGSQLATGIKP